MLWFEEYIGLPWAKIPSPPHSFTCGELVRYIMKKRLGIDMPEILANAAVLKECLRDLGDPSRYGLHPLQKGVPPREYDIAYMIKATRQDHVGIAVESPDGLLVLHCTQGQGVRTALRNCWARPAAGLIGTGIMLCGRASAGRADRDLDETPWQSYYTKQDGPVCA